MSRASLNYLAMNQSSGLSTQQEAVRGIVSRRGLDTEEQMLPLKAMLQRLSEARDPHELFSLAARYTADGPVSGEPHAILVVTTAGLAAGEYQITRRLLAVPRKRMTVEVSDDPDALPRHRAGFVGTLLRRRDPELLTGLKLRGDPVLTSEFAEFDSCLVLPLFSGGRNNKWVLLFRRGWDEVEFEHVASAMLIMNLIESSIDNILIADRVENLHKILDQQFEQLTRVQRRMLPRAKPEAPSEWERAPMEGGRLDVGMSYSTAHRAGGDYFNFFELPGGRLGVVVADVSGHGADAAMIMGMVHAVLHSDAPLQEGPSAVLRFLNRRLLPLMHDGRFITACAAIFDPMTGSVAYSTAGHPAPRLRRADGSIEKLEGAAGDLIGVIDDDDLTCREATTTLHPGDAVFFYTDGLTESFDPEGNAFGPAKLDVSVAQCAGSAAAMASRLAAAANSHHGVEGQDDDVTVVVVQFCVGR